jgi:hypothetical protein
MIGFPIALVWLFLVFVIAGAAKEKGRSYGWFLVLGLFLSPLVSFIVLMAMGENKEALQQQRRNSGVMKQCPFCANEIKAAAVVCQYCGRDLPKEHLKETAITPEMIKAMTGKTGGEGQN